LNGVQEKGLFSGSAAFIFLKVAIFILLIYFIIIELIQMAKSGLLYLTDKWNWLNLITYTANVVILSLYVWDLRELDPLSLAEATSVLSFLIWAQMF
jgi:hypothetical protein